ncbi:CcoQ/FixQ family Cbb3-type cytochrome c oxidase assembly chaperone [Leptospira perolatii]|uniref:CcoQ/FixQ family Cbb3-type cytochrome c oxidase assembly chaperone n=1 Tax=Leptospira perolatii TaxID=2023191 RepID=A0A2M9ZQF1_9LEPT|nr:CcoQ/FixQ family Cbb3-type cytochrome c oxidase assembly chaperone [Leptospira perolatii]PJZ70460.1 CcoQ/FixQ family Cbb3-type cytochrome c oxidase assembly chaperone [Leptospira perolatii]PJZ74296.1 CcoQ/FixQ family Cbb3-type cytochrome c oxidase assembly chaperone [Leptospira perolatii]
MELDTLQIYKSLRLPLLVLAITIITFYVYSRKRKERMENPKYRMLEED